MILEPGSHFSFISAAIFFHFDVKQIMTTFNSFISVNEPRGTRYVIYLHFPFSSCCPQWHRKKCISCNNYWYSAKPLCRQIDDGIGTYLNKISRTFADSPQNLIKFELLSSKCCFFKSTSWIEIFFKFSKGKCEIDDWRCLSVLLCEWNWVKIAENFVVRFLEILSKLKNYENRW